ncbi:hypothetical protein D3C84_802270 [compost metagenome]
MSDGLDHLDRYQFIETSAQITVILAQHRNTLLQAQRLHTLARISVLRVGECRGGNAAAVAGSGMDGQAAPAAANLQKMLVGFELKLLADAFQLVQLGRFKGLFGTVELCGGVHHSRVEQSLEQGVAQVVMGENVASSASSAVPVEPVQQAQDRAPESRQACLHGVEDIEVGNEQTGHSR